MKNFKEFLQEQNELSFLFAINENILRESDSDFLQQIDVDGYNNMGKNKDAYLRLQRLWAAKKAFDEKTTIDTNTRKYSQAFLLLYWAKDLEKRKQNRKEIYEFLKNSGNIMHIQSMLDPDIS